MNGQDKQDLNVILERMEQADKDRSQIHSDIKFIKENLFNPHEGLWAESKQNTQFRKVIFLVKSPIKDFVRRFSANASKAKQATSRAKQITL